MSLFFLSLLFYLLLISEQGFLIFCLRPILFLFTVSLSFSVLPFMLFPVISALIPFFFFHHPLPDSLFHLSFISLSSLFRPILRRDDRMRIRAFSAKIATENSLPISVQSLETAWALSDRNNVSGE